MAEWGQYEIDDVRATGKRTADAVEKIADVMKKSQTTDRELIEAFNKVAKQLEILTAEVRGLRQDLSPDLDKPALPGPARKG